MIRWLLLKGTWHAWAHGESASACGTRTVEQLRAHPATSMVEALPPENAGLACGTCRRLHPPAPVSDEGLIPGGDGSPSMIAWLNYLKRHLKRIGGRADEADLRAVALMIAAVGTPDDAKARDLFDQVRDLLLPRPTAPAFVRVRKPVTFPRLREAVAKLPPRSAELQQVASAMRVWRKVTGRADPGRFKPDVVIDTMLALPAEVETYVTHLKERGLDSLAQVFHPSTMARAKKDPALRGLFGTGASYWEETREQMYVIK